MPDEILAVIIVSIAAVTAITILKTILGYHERTGSGSNDQLETRTRTQKKSKGSSDGASLTTSELESMVERAAAGAVGPLREDLEVMAARLDAMEERLGAGVLDLDDQFESGETSAAKTKTMGAREQ